MNKTDFKQVCVELVPRLSTWSYTRSRSLGAGSRYGPMAGALRAQLYTGWQWRNFVPYLCQLVSKYSSEFTVIDLMYINQCRRVNFWQTRFARQHRGQSLRSMNALFIIHLDYRQNTPPNLRSSTNSISVAELIFFWFHAISIMWNDVTESMVTMRSPFCGYNLAQCVELVGEDLPRYSLFKQNLTS